MKLINKKYLINSYCYELINIYDSSKKTEIQEVYISKDVDEAILQDKKDFVSTRDSITNEIINIKKNCKDKVILKSLNFILLYLSNHEAYKEHNLGSNNETIKSIPSKEQKTIYRKNNITYYKFRKDALERRNKGDRLYYKAGEGYYIIRPIKRGFWF